MRGRMWLLEVEVVSLVAASEEWDEERAAFTYSMVFSEAY